MNDLQISARNAVAKYLGHTRGHAATLVGGLSEATCQAIVDATKLGDEKKIAAKVGELLKAGDGEQLAAHKAAVKKDQADSDPATGLVKKGKKAAKAESDKPSVSEAGGEDGQAAGHEAAEKEAAAATDEAPAAPAKKPAKKAGKK